MTPPTSTPVTPNSRVALVTGANSGIGRVTAVELALRGYHVFLACRDAGKTAEVLDEIAQRSGGTAGRIHRAGPRRPGQRAPVRPGLQRPRAAAAPAGQQRRAGRPEGVHEIRVRAGLRRLPCRPLPADPAAAGSPQASSAVARRGGGQPGAPPRQGHRLRRRAPAQPQPRRPDGLQRRQAGQHSVRGRTGAPPGGHRRDHLRAAPRRGGHQCVALGALAAGPPGQAVHDRLGRRREDHAVLRHVRCGGAADRPVLRQVRRGHAHAGGPGCRAGAGAVDGQRGWTQD
jgi:hypothetical protein